MDYGDRASPTYHQTEVLGPNYQTPLIDGDSDICQNYPQNQTDTFTYRQSSQNSLVRVSWSGYLPRSTAQHKFSIKVHFWTGLVTESYFVYRTDFNAENPQFEPGLKCMHRDCVAIRDSHCLCSSSSCLIHKHIVGGGTRIRTNPALIAYTAQRRAAISI